MKTNLELHRHAQEAAAELIDSNNSLDRLKAATAAFESSGAHKDDWDYWFNEFDRVRNHYIATRSQGSKGGAIWAKEEAAAKEAALKAAAAAPVPPKVEGSAS